ncbi:energy-coupling factor transporter transmembrane component T [Caloramator sp. CAR-1]|uniref:energy-coupling factor transporter transmembrane component T n=1 Tax=Caloramator sp. CAR-1 TaxID=3062777 RepID=UPI0026E32E3F|nr:energy-coupling factor transporter transmembrane component T [Caloramator sp. CAR-1]MDO6353845.1 energy-coupling factor transporter transmembrane component T [Caloramator sp. CAR-1]
MLNFSRDKFIQRFNTLTNIILILTYIIAFLMINNILILAIILISLILLAKVNEIHKEVFAFFRFSVFIALIIIIFNLLINKNGETQIFIIGDFYITLESFYYSLFMASRLIAIMMTFAFGNLIINPDDAFSIISKIFGKSSLVMSLVYRLSFSLINQINNIKEIEFIRGNTFEGNLYKRIKSYGEVVNILFLSSLEDSIELAEAMYSRGYGSTKRSSFKNQNFNFRDYVIILMCTISIGFLIGQLILGLNSFKFFPQIDSPLKKITVYEIIILFVFYSIVFVNWWWINGNDKN